VEDSKLNFEKYREMFPVTKNWNYLATGATGPLSISVEKACSEYIAENTKEGFKFYSEIDDYIEKPKRLFAKLINCSEDELAFVPNSTHGINLVSQMLRPKKGENVVITDLEYFGCAYPWLLTQTKGVDVRVAKSKKGMLPIETIEALVDDRTKAISVAHVCHSGLRQDLKALSKIAHDHGAYMVSDAIGTCGIVDVDVRDNQIDFLSTSSYKWLLGLQGAGFLYIKRKLVDSFDPPFPGSHATPDVDSAKLMLSPTWGKIKFPKSARRYETGMPAILPAVSLSASLELLLEIGMSNVEKRVSDLTQYAIEKMQQFDLKVITPEEPKLRGGHIIVLMKNGKLADDVFKTLFKKKIHIQRFTPSYGPKEGAIFVAPDFFNTESEIDSFTTELKKLIYN
jgi:cysteine desulfurase / selenocysteine lyase